MSFLTKLLGGIAKFGTGGLAGPLIEAGASLLGGALNNKAEKAGIAAQNAYNDPAQIRARAEAAGFNPLSFIGPGVGNQTAAVSGSYMGSAIADAGMAMADGIANSTKRKQAEQLGALEIENAKLQNKLLQLTLRPKVGGVYAQRETTPTIAAAVGGGNAGEAGLFGVTATSSAGVSGSVGLGGSANASGDAIRTSDNWVASDGTVFAGPGSKSMDLEQVVGAAVMDMYGRGVGLGRQLPKSDGPRYGRSFADKFWSRLASEASRASSAFQRGDQRNAKWVASALYPAVHATENQARAFGQNWYREQFP